MTDKLFLSY